MGGWRLDGCFRVSACLKSVSDSAPSFNSAHDCVLLFSSTFPLYSTRTMADDTQTPLPVDAPAPATQAGPSTPALAPPQEAALPPIKNLVLDAAPLLTLFPLRGLAQRYLIAPQVLAEIRDKRAREHFERLGLVEGVEVEVRAPDALSMARGSSFRLRLQEGRLNVPAVAD